MLQKIKKILAVMVACTVLFAGVFFFVGCRGFGGGGGGDNTTTPPPTDYPAIHNQIMVSTIRACISLEVEFYNTNFLGQKTGSVLTKQGSGAIIYQGRYSDTNNPYYLALTNDHVVRSEPGYSNRAIKAIDYKGNEYTAFLDVAVYSYDLATIYFTKTAELGIIQRATTNPTIGQEIISIGRPNGQHNAVTYGIVQKYQVADMADRTNLPFPSMFHTAPITSGSSGGPVLDLQLRLVAINHAGTNSDGLKLHGTSCAIPIQKVNEFLNAYVWS